MSRLLVLELPHHLSFHFHWSATREPYQHVVLGNKERIRKVELSDDVLSGFPAAPSEKIGLLEIVKIAAVPTLQSLLRPQALNTSAGLTDSYTS